MGGIAAARGTRLPGHPDPAPFTFPLIQERLWKQGEQEKGRCEHGTARAVNPSYCLVGSWEIFSGSVTSYRKNILNS